MFRATVRGREPMVLGWSTTSSTGPCLESLPSIVRMAFSSCFNGLSYRVFPSWSRACAWWRALAHVQADPHVDVVRGHHRSSRHEGFPVAAGSGSPDARAAPTLRRDLAMRPLKRPCSRPGFSRRSSGIPIPATNPPDHRRRAGKSYRNRQPGPNHRGLPNMVMGGFHGRVCNRDEINMISLQFQEIP